MKCDRARLLFDGASLRQLTHEELDDLARYMWANDGYQHLTHSQEHLAFADQTQRAHLIGGDEPVGSAHDFTCPLIAMEERIWGELDPELKEVWRGLALGTFAKVATLLGAKLIGVAE